MFARVVTRSVSPLIVCAVTCLLWSLVAVSVAQAAFPGRNGLLAVQPLAGRGLLLVGVSGHHPRRICSVMAACRRPLNPQFSPDGRSLIFASRLGIRTITTNGTCLDCRFVRGSSPAFAPGGTLVTFVSRKRVIACPTTTLCIAAGDGAGDALVSRDPTAGSNAWTPVLVDPVACPPSQRCGTEKIIASDRTGIHTVDSSTEFEAQTGPQLTDLALSGDTLSWLHSGARGSATLFP